MPIKGQLIMHYLCRPTSDIVKKHLYKQFSLGHEIQTSVSWGISSAWDMKPVTVRAC